MSSFNPESDVSGTIARLFVYPVKSCAGVEVQEALLTETGLDLDRAWMVVDAQGEFVTQRSQPRMALIRPQIRTSEVVLRAPGMLALHLGLDTVEAPASVTLWGETVPAWDMGAVAAQWFSDFLGQPCRLVRFDPEYQRLSSMRWTGGVEAPNQFSDGFPVLVCSEASLQDLNARLGALGHAAVGIERFRPNVVLAGGEPHDEDRLDMIRLDAADAEVHLQPVKPCARCPIPDVDPATGETGTAVGSTLRTYRQDRRLDGAITFGMNAIVRRGAGSLLRVGQRFAADLRFD
ncbi:MOSC domain-containing protein [Acidovorax sp. RAC01]|uniref:MOSC domain-containing protein n=1 Tax=Acidovorax sp. RAC01 TaxID=1842533 RepID=UPI00083E7CF2|nr:MOSC N-terminal beta barrel domain-containing protein [Acidovorax sp. RAC01]AOG22272.1 MOSC domain protein [Acidovorax sp. RAC01]